MDMGQQWSDVEVVGIGNVFWSVRLTSRWLI